jgi:hypothetical protein
LLAGATGTGGPVDLRRSRSTRAHSHDEGRTDRSHRPQPRPAAGSHQEGRRQSPRPRVRGALGLLRPRAGHPDPKPSVHVSEVRDLHQKAAIRPRGVNPRTLEPIEIEACETVDFKPSVELKRQLNEASVAKPAKAKTKTKTKTKRGARAAQATQAASGSGSGSGSPASKPATRKKKKAARSSAKRRPAANSGTPAKVEVNKPHAAGPGGRKLVTREEAELELPSSEPLLPEAPLQRVARKRRADAQTGNNPRATPDQDGDQGLSGPG